LKSWEMGAIAGQENLIASVCFRAMPIRPPPDPRINRGSRRDGSIWSQGVVA